MISGITRYFPQNFIQIDKGIVKKVKEERTGFNFL